MAAATPRIIVVGGGIAGAAALCIMGLLSIYAVVYKYPNARADVMPAQPVGVVAPTVKTSSMDFRRLNRPRLINASFEITQDTSSGVPPPSSEVPVGAHPVQVPSMMDHVVQKFYPRYTEALVKKEDSGVVTLQALIGTDGTVKELKATKGPYDLKQEALRAVAMWRYKPYLLNGHPTEVTTPIKIRFVLRNPKPADAQDVDLVVSTEPQPLVLTKAHEAKPLPPGRVRLSPNDLFEYTLTKVEPVYPPQAKKAGVTGNVIVEIVIDKTGKLIESEAIMGTPMFYTSAIDAVRQWTFKPYLRNGQPTEVETSVLVPFP